MKKTQSYDVYVRCTNKIVENIVNTVREHVVGKGLNGQYMRVNYSRVTEKPKPGKTLFSFCKTDDYDVALCLKAELDKIVELHHEEEQLQLKLFKCYQHIDGILPGFFVRRDVFVNAFTTINNDDVKLDTDFDF